MDKTQFLNCFCEEDKVILSSIYDKMKLADRTGRSVYTNEFYTPNIWRKLVTLGNPFGLKVECSGIFKNSERRMICFSKECEEKEYPFVLLRIDNLSKFESLTHRDYLGAVMGLGIVRNKLGDLVLGDNCCYVAAIKETAEFVAGSMEKIKRCRCNIKVIDIAEQNIPDIQFEEFNIISTSLRLDSLVSSICNISRSKAVELINSSSVSVDYIVTKEKDYTVSADETITIRGYGKYKIVKNIGITGRERMKLLMKKFV